jgi:hypothetical protein
VVLAIRLSKGKNSCPASHAKNAPVSRVQGGAQPREIPRRISPTAEPGTSWTVKWQFLANGSNLDPLWIKRALSAA